VSGEVLVIANVEVPDDLQRRGWFWTYVQMCVALIGDAIVIEEVVNPDLYAALVRSEVFVEIRERTFVINKRGAGDWPLTKGRCDD
jgi:hypothetical protein